MKKIITVFLFLLVIMSTFSTIVMASNDVCEHVYDPYATPIDRGPLAYYEKVAESNKCYKYVYYNASYICNICGHEWTGTYIHYTYHRMVDCDTYEQCMDCGYMRTYD